MIEENQKAIILVVDDEPDLEYLILQKFRKKIVSNEYVFEFARNGAQALEKIVNNTSINLILTDINMPVMDGLTLLSKINELNNGKYQNSNEQRRLRFYYKTNRLK
jgi:CheY-like chemotaxis protein